MKYAISHLRKEEHRLQIDIEEVREKAEEVPVIPETAQTRSQISHIQGLNAARLKDIRDALKELEKI